MRLLLVEDEPMLDGLSVLRRWRDGGRTMPVLILAARGLAREGRRHRRWRRRLPGEALSHGRIARAGPRADPPRGVPNERRNPLRHAELGRRNARDCRPAPVMRGRIGRSCAPGRYRTQRLRYPRTKRPTRRLVPTAFSARMARPCVRSIASSDRPITR